MQHFLSSEQGLTCGRYCNEVLQLLLLRCLKQAPEAPGAHHRLCACQCCLKRINAACIVTHALQLLLIGLMGQLLLAIATGPPPSPSWA